ncbi:Putative sensor [Pseudonocardia thermophila]|jgi:hypothetical protein|uniref:Putative sensor n=3 Tax=Pseudonocardia thermophila TaxID=1848 RepID=A0A1M7AQ74_PSETH|nr:Putative sensor [Pseudonocardia thermophila]
MLRMGALVLGMEVAAVAFALLGFGWLALLIGLPLIVATLLIVVVAAWWERRRAAQQAREEQEREEAAARARALDPEGTVYLTPGLMSGFFELPSAALPARPQEPAASQIPTQATAEPAPDRVHH